MMSGELEQESGTEGPGPDYELLDDVVHDDGIVPETTDAAPDTSGRMQLFRASAERSMERAANFARSKPRSLIAVLATVGVLTGLGLIFSNSLTAALHAALPERVVGNVGAPENGNEGALQIRMGGGAPGRSTSGAQNVDLRDAGLGSRADYLPQPKLGDLATASTIITVPLSQGRLLRFDDTVESVFIADPSIADVRMVSSDLVYVYGKSLGLTNLMAVSGRGGQTDGSAGRQEVSASALLRVVMDMRPANEARQELSPMTPVDINVFGKRTVIKGHMRNIDQAVDAANIAQSYSPSDQPPINNTTLAGSNQINIRVRFAEVRRDDLKSFGIDWNIGGSGGNFSFGLAKTGATTESTRNLTLGGSIGKFNLDLFIEALQANGALTILAEPNLTAVTGETASFLAGGEVPIPVPTGNGKDSITIQYKQFGVSLSFTPTMVKDNRISLRVKPEVSSIDGTTNFGLQGFNFPSFNVRRAETAVEMASGQTFAMAGLFQREVSRNVDKVPLLGDVPVLGPLFRSERYKRNETELVILITPYLVNPVSDGSLATPLDRAGPSAWQADIVGPDMTSKGAAYAEPVQQSGFILK
jgi:pilus assembly protein CpaC